VSAAGIRSTFSTAQVALTRGWFLRRQGLFWHRRSGGSIGTAVTQLARGLGRQNTAMSSTTNHAKAGRRRRSDSTKSSMTSWRRWVTAASYHGRLRADLVIDGIGGDVLSAGSSACVGRKHYKHWGIPQAVRTNHWTGRISLPTGQIRSQHVPSAAGGPGDAMNVMSNRFNPVAIHTDLLRPYRLTKRMMHGVNR